ncbi:MAG: hypothetical protein P0Y55_17620 [Candidatus Cohnella colombiensis]|uniref:Uncharacterized protein n=1 Tax=Candidatus Cohnella colombiensis TaxID=3121368 RepID=A0AA95EWD1_9BACL|nr:MAG: hypothetical protein P0Y55_17620 [Cohnella sp.]
MKDFFYIFVSTFEASAALILMLHLFRFSVVPYWKYLIYFSVFFAVLSFTLRVSLNLSSYFPLITIAFFVLFAFYIMRAPLFWSFVIATITTITTTVLQTSVLLAADWLHIIDIELEDQTNLISRMLQFISAILSVTISSYLYRRGIGFAFNFDRFRLKWENLLMITIALLLFLAFFVTFFNHEFYFSAMISLVTFIFLLFFALRKEKADLD